MNGFWQQLLAVCDQAAWRHRRYGFARVSDTGPGVPVADGDWAGQLGSMDEWMHLETGGGRGRTPGEYLVD